MLLRRRLIDFAVDKLTDANARGNSALLVLTDIDFLDQLTSAGWYDEPVTLYVVIVFAAAAVIAVRDEFGVSACPSLSIGQSQNESIDVFDRSMAV
ncbi:hypothetical protein RB195_004973 [Necator americanus]|uniref:Uncharacterized protein n=1 Tax=Necator americanus TaxID=51031 RepID=A0ABR1BKK9_NECAM